MLGENIMHKQSWELLQIEDDEKNYQKYMLEYDNNNGRIIINKDNVLRVNAMINSNSTYKEHSKEESLPILKRGDGNEIIDKMSNGDFLDQTYIDNDKEKYKYLGSTKYWFEKLNKLIDKDITEKIEIEYYTSSKKNKTKTVDVSLGYVIFKTVCCVDNDNSTHLNSDSIGRRLLAYRIFQMRDELMNKLKQSNYSIINELSERIKEDEKNILEKGTSNYHISFASKWCHNACYYMLEDKYKDNFSKVDSVVKEALKMFEEDLKVKGLNFDILRDNTKKDNRTSNEKIGENYGEYIKIIDAVRTMSDDPISRNGLDHLLWYSYK